MRKAAELVVLGKRSLCPDRLKAPGGRLFQPGQRILREDIPQQSYTLLPQLRGWIIGRHIASVAEPARLWRRLDLLIAFATGLSFNLIGSRDPGSRLRSEERRVGQE